MTFDFTYLASQLPALWRAAGMTLAVSGISIVLSALLSALIVNPQTQKSALARAVSKIYIEVFKNTPILVQLFFIFYGLPAIGIVLSPFWSGVVCLTLWGGAFQAENVRGGLEAVRPGLKDAASALGFTPWMYVILIALPLAVRVAMPSMLNTAITLLKNSAYLQAIGLSELTFVAMDRVSMDFHSIEMFSALLAIYLGIVLVMSVGARIIEHRLNRAFVMVR